MCLRKFKVSLSLSWWRALSWQHVAGKNSEQSKNVAPAFNPTHSPYLPFNIKLHIFFLSTVADIRGPIYQRREEEKKIQNLFEIFVCLCRNLLENHIKRKMMYNIEHTGTYKHTHFESKDIQYTHKAYRQTCDGLVFHLSLSYTFIFRNHIHNIHLATRTANIKI